MPLFNTIRLAVFGVTCGFALIVMGLAASFLASYGSSTTSSMVSISSVPGFAVATPVLTFVILIPALVFHFLRKNTVTSLTASELGFVGFLWVLWLACAANSTAAFSGVNLICGSSSTTSSYSSLNSFSNSYTNAVNSQFASFCSQYQALQAFSWLNWLMLLSYWIALLSIALTAQSRGVKNAFMLPSTELASSMPAAGESKNQTYPPGGVPPSTYPPQGQYPQQSYTPSQYPQQSYTPSPMPPQGQMYQPSHVSSPAPPPSGVLQV